MVCKSCHKQRKFPKYREMIKDLGITMKNAIRHAIVEHQVIAPKSVIQRRLDTCMRCEYLEGKRCLKCGCFVITKAGLEVSKCPMGFW